MKEGADDSVSTDKRILLVEDDPDILKLIQRALARSGYDIEPAVGPTEALELASAGARFDLVITDVIMPTKNGLDLVREIRAHQPDIRVLFMSGYSADILDELDDVEREQAFIQKPFNKSDFVDRVAAVLRDS
ncbi:MAG: response regulator [Gammaproteobacteria bacterium]|nr:response regulator [Gammaproteobacteria bacterium]